MVKVVTVLRLFVVGIVTILDEEIAIVTCSASGPREATVTVGS